LYFLVELLPEPFWRWLWWPIIEIIYFSPELNQFLKDYLINSSKLLFYKWAGLLCTLSWEEFLNIKLKLFTLRHNRQRISFTSIKSSFWMISGIVQLRKNVYTNKVFLTRKSFFSLLSHFWMYNVFYLNKFKSFLFSWKSD
jgi:hypothetical protein